eukprot:scaffold112346_cov34-Prasinocladus_malaysianus.AAC.2
MQRYQLRAASLTAAGRVVPLVEVEEGRRDGDNVHLVCLREVPRADRDAAVRGGEHAADAEQA